jgi:hypothetical protein
MNQCDTCKYDFEDCDAVAWFDYKAGENPPYLSECDKYEPISRLDLLEAT